MSRIREALGDVFKQDAPWLGEEHEFEYAEERPGTLVSKSAPISKLGPGLTGEAGHEDVGLSVEVVQDPGGNVRVADIGMDGCLSRPAKELADRVAELDCQSWLEARPVESLGCEA